MALVSAMQVARNGSNYLSASAAANLTPDELASAIYGSKMTLALEQLTLFTTWQAKACLLLLYYQLMSAYISIPSLRHTKTLNFRFYRSHLKKPKLAVKILAGYCVLSFILIQILLFGVWCRPIQQYWAVPVKNC